MNCSKPFAWLSCMQFIDSNALENRCSCAFYGQLIIIQLLSWSARRASPIHIDATSILTINVSQDGGENHGLHGPLWHGYGFGLSKAALASVLPYDISYMHCFVRLLWGLDHEVSHECGNLAHVLFGIFSRWTNPSRVREHTLDMELWFADLASHSLKDAMAETFACCHNLTLVLLGLQAALESLDASRLSDANANAGLLFVYLLVHVQALRNEI